MGARIFISYRTTDGMDKATALARDLGRVFGDEAVFLDKDDLPGGSAWRQEIGHTLSQRPVLLLLLTPGVLEARAADGSLRIADPADPVRREVEAARAAGAHLIPLLCDGLHAPPDVSTLPPPFDHLGELTWRKLRAYDWKADIDRLVQDLRALGLAPVAEHAPAPAVASARRSVLVLAAAAVLAGGAALVWWWSARTPGAPPVAGAAGAPGIAGRWTATLWQGERTLLVITQTPAGLTLASEPIAIAARPDWVDYRKFWRERFQAELDAVMYRGEGLVRSDPGQPVAIDVAIKVHPVPGAGEPIDSGNLSATLSADGQRLDGRIWLNSVQAEQPASLVREGAAPTAANAAARAAAIAPAAAPLPQISLAGPAELGFEKHRPSSYRVLALLPEPGHDAGWRLRAKIRLSAAPNSGGMGFWDSSFRLLIDGVPRAPDNRINEMVDSAASKDGELVWVVPPGVRSLVLRVHHYGESGELPLALSGAPPAPAVASSASAAGPIALALGAPAEVQFTRPAPATFTVLGISSRARRSGVHGVHVRLRMTLPAGAVPANFWNDQFRLLVDGVPRAPDSDLNLVVEGGSARDGEVAFEVPTSAKALVLRIQYAADAVADLPLKMENRP
jgi:TIR domain